MEKENLKWLRNILFKAFIINYILVVLVWLLHLTWLYNFLMQCFFSFDSKETAALMVYLFGAWKVLATTFFLVPAIAIHCSLKKEKK